MNELSSARACRYSSLTGPGSDPSRAAAPRAARAPPLHRQSGRGAQPVQRGKDLVRNLRLHRDQIQRSHANRSARAHALRGHVEQLPVQVEALFRAQKAARQHKRDQQLLSHGKRVHLRDGQRHQRARRPHHERGNARQPRRNGIGQRKAVERRNLGRAQIGKGQHHQRILRRARPPPTRETAPPASREARVALLRLRGRGGQVGRRVAGNDAGLNLQRLHDGLERLAHFGGRGVRAPGFFSRHRDHALQLRRNPGTISLRSGGSENWMARMA
jgi:hypothetical protein